MSEKHDADNVRLKIELEKLINLHRSSFHPRLIFRISQENYELELWSQILI